MRSAATPYAVIVQPLLRRLLLCCLISSILCQPASATLGETIGSFRGHTKKLYLFKKESGKGATRYYMFSLILDAQQQQAAPELAAGITVTLTNNRVSGESMAIKFNNDSSVCKILAMAKSLEFVYQAIGKSAPKNSTEAKAEYDAFSGASDQALGGIAQSIKYRGFEARVILSRTDGGELIIAVVPETLPKPEQGGTGKKK